MTMKPARASRAATIRSDRADRLPMAADVLYLVKANRVQEGHHPNLAILAAPEGERFEITYAER